MISKTLQKYVQCLHLKKFRSEYERFLVEGEKNILELLDSDFEVEHFWYSEKFVNKSPHIQSFGTLVSEESIQKVSTLKTNTAGLAVVKKKSDFFTHFKGLTLALDGIADPGNLGTIVRLADWYGVNKIIISHDSVEFYNPKTIASTMGSFARLQPLYTYLEDFFISYPLPIFSTLLSGLSVHEVVFPKDCCVLIGSESHGIRNYLHKYINNPITIPQVGKAESLNAAIATGIVLDNFLRSSK